MLVKSVRSKKMNSSQYDTCTIQYLQMIQEPISRMSTTSAVIKGFTVTASLGVASISIENGAKCLSLLSLILLIAFFAMDAYYLSIERKYRYLYKKVLNGEHPVDFSMNLENDPVTKFEAKARFIDCVSSPSIYLFYLAMALFIVCVYVLC